MTTDLRLVTSPANARRDDPFAAIQSALRRLPQVRSESSSTHVTICAADSSGFDVTFRENAGRYVVRCSGWHDEFASAESALNCFFKALGAECRLRVVMRGQTQCSWQLQVLSEEKWQSLTGRRRLLIPFWFRPRVIWLQNDFVEAA